MSNLTNPKNNLEKRSQIATVADMLDKMKEQMAMALPKHITPERMVRVALTAVQNTPKLLECDRNSLLMAILRACQLGLEPDGILGQAYLIPYAKQVQLIVGYKGLIDLARRSGEVSNIIAREVCANDIFTVDFSQEVPFVHKPKLDGDRGPVKFFWALARFKDGGFHWDYMSRDEVLKIRDGSSGWQTAVKYGKTADSPWSKHEIEMGKKTMIRRISKYLPMSVQRAAKVEDFVDAGKTFSADSFGEIICEEEEIQDITPQDLKPENTGNENAKKNLEAKKEKVTSKPAKKEEVAAEEEPAAKDVTPTKTTQAAAAKPAAKAAHSFDMFMPGGEVIQMPGGMASNMISRALQEMSDSEELQFLRDNVDNIEELIKILRADKAVSAADHLDDLMRA